LSENDLEFAEQKGILEKKGHGYTFLNGKLSWRKKDDLYDIYLEEPDNKFLKLLHYRILKEAHNEVLSMRNGEKKTDDAGAE
jgi:hypothetical protein